jgi:hypothetical protein
MNQVKCIKKIQGFEVDKIYNLKDLDQSLTVKQELPDNKGIMRNMSIVDLWISQGYFEVVAETTQRLNASVKQEATK